MIDELSKIPLLYHFTDRRNLPSIVKSGGLLPLSLINKKGIAVAAPGGNQWSQEEDVRRGLNKYVHLCFRNNHPMEHIARGEGRIGDTVFLKIHPSVLQWPGVRFTPDVSNKSGVQSMPIEDANAIIDFQVLYTRTDWNDPVINQRLKQAEKCEVLVPSFIPLDLIRGID